MAMFEKVAHDGIRYVSTCTVAIAQTIEVDSHASDFYRSRALRGRYMNICGRGQDFTESDFKLYQEQFGRLKLVRVWVMEPRKYRLCRQDRR